MHGAAYVNPSCAAHDYELWMTFHHAPTGPYPSHTSFILLLCQRCGAYTCFPWSNYDLCTPDFRQLLERLAVEAGWFLTRHQEGG